MMADFNVLSDEIKAELDLAGGCVSGSVDDGYTDTTATVRVCPLLQRCGYGVDLDQASPLVDRLGGPLDVSAYLSSAQSQADADAGRTVLKEVFGAVDDDDANNRACALVAWMTWRAA